MNKKTIDIFAIGLLLLAFIGGLAWADQSDTFLNEAQDRAATRACSFDAVTAQKVTTSGTSAPTTNATGKGTVRVLCTKDAHFKQAASPTARTARQGPRLSRRAPK